VLAWAVLKGRCLCGAVAYEIEGDPIVVAHCHCVDCQRISGAAHTTGATFPADRIRVAGDVAQFQLRSERGSMVTRTFCPRCGSPLFGRNTGMDGFVTVSVGTLDDPDAVMPQVVIFARTRRHWDAMDPGLPTFETQPDWEPADGI
jgi:hypothetical protein